MLLSLFYLFTFRTCVPVGHGLEVTPPIVCARWRGGVGWTMCKEVQCGSQSHCSHIVNTVYSVAPPKYIGGGHGPSLVVCAFVYIFKPRRHMYKLYIIPGPGYAQCVHNVHIHLVLDKLAGTSGTQWSTITHDSGYFYPLTQTRSFGHRDPMVHFNPLLRGFFTLRPARG